MEYKTSHPDGVLFEVVDRHDVVYDVNNKQHNGHSNGNMEKPMSGAQLLNRIPKVVINNGNIVHMRDDLKNRLESGPSSEAKEADITLGTSKNPIIIKSHVDTISTNTNTSPIATVQIRWSIPTEHATSTTTNVFQIELYGNDDIDRLKSIFCMSLNEEEENNPTDCIYFPIIDPNQIEFRNTYPSRVLKSIETLQDIGFVPNGIINAKLLLRK